METLYPKEEEEEEEGGGRKREEEEEEKDQSDRLDSAQLWYFRD